MRLYCSDTYRVLRLSRVCGACIFSTGERGSLRRLVRRRIRDGSISALASSCGSAIVLATTHAPPVRTSPQPYLPPARTRYRLPTTVLSTEPRYYSRSYYVY